MKPCTTSSAPTGSTRIGMRIKDIRCPISMGDAPIGTTLDHGGLLYDLRSHAGRANWCEHQGGRRMSWWMDEGWHESDDDGEAWKAEGMADAEDWNPDSW